MASGRRPGMTVPTDGCQQLKDMLAGRPDWRLEYNASGLVWCFGQEGASRLVISFDADHFVIYSANTDEEIGMATIEGVREWLERLESGHAGWTELQKELGGYLLASEAEPWLRTPPDAPEGGSQ
jgi:hypothetical protein